ncbi:MAG: pro-sigmaK processing inhibitor BofA family protein [Clostridia bacterium]|nr:pro-sigmaK processing inhibitor BofA family protein [Clostridia bacterium]
MAELPGIAIFVIAVVVLYLILKVISVPIKILKWVVCNAIVGGIVLFLLNLIGGYFGLHIDINIISALVTGVLGIPGVILLIILKFLA